MLKSATEPETWWWDALTATANIQAATRALRTAQTTFLAMTQHTHPTEAGCAMYDAMHKSHGKYAQRIATLRITQYDYPGVGCSSERHSFQYAEKCPRVLHDLATEA